MADPPIIRFRTSGPTPDERSAWRTGGASEALQRQYQIADHLQREVALRIRASVEHGRWAADSSGRLERVTVDGANRRADFYTISIGIPSFLNRSMVKKYWRTQELGSIGAGWRFVGRIVMPRDFGKKPGGAGTRAAGMTERYWHPSWQDTRFRTISNIGGFASRLGDDRFRVKNEIAPQHAYRDVLQEFGRQRTFRDFANNAAQSYLHDILRKAFVDGSGNVWSR